MSTLEYIGFFLNEKKNIHAESYSFSECQLICVADKYTHSYTLEGLFTFHFFFV